MASPITATARGADIMELPPAVTKWGRDMLLAGRLSPYLRKFALKAIQRGAPISVRIEEDSEQIKLTYFSGTTPKASRGSE